MTKHTPGPWKWLGGTRHHASLDSPGRAILVHNALWGVRRSDARLIVAAPEMLMALREAERAFRNCPGNWPIQTHDLVTAAIAKATGEEP